MAFKDTLHRGLGRATEPQILFPFVAAFLLAVTTYMEDDREPRLLIEHHRRPG
jgi:hypothetical protein